MSETGTSTAASEATSSIEWVREFVERWREAWNSHDADRLLALMTEDVEYRDDSWPKTMHGHSDVREFLNAIWRAMPDMNFELLAGPYVDSG
jgi:ketosteroid isomerase-like protein